jgi:hypothetical protein
MRGTKHIAKAMLPLLLLLAGSTIAAGQRRNPPPALPMAIPSQSGSTHGTLTVTVTVDTSVGVLKGPDGQQRIVIANAADAADNVSHFVMLIDRPATTSAEKTRKGKKQKTAILPRFSSRD